MVRHFQMKLMYGHHHGFLQINMQVFTNQTMLVYQEIRNLEKKVILHQHQRNYKHFHGLIKLVRIHLLLNTVFIGHNLLLLN